MGRCWWWGSSGAWEAATSRLRDVVVHRRYLQWAEHISKDWIPGENATLALPASKEVMTELRTGSLCGPWCCSRSWINPALPSCTTARSRPATTGLTKRIFMDADSFNCSEIHRACGSGMMTFCDTPSHSELRNRCSLVIALQLG